MMTRRTFAGGICGVMATAALPRQAHAGAAADSAGAAGNEHLALAYRHVRIGLERPFSVLHVSDTHLTAAYESEGQDKMEAAAQRTRTFGGRQEAALRKSLAWAKANADFLLHTGDLVDFQSEANFDLVKRYFGDAMFGAVGNHEFYTYLPGEKYTYQESFKDRSWPLLAGCYPMDARFASRIVNGVDFVSLDDVFGTVMPDQVEKFMLEVRKGLPIVLCMHVPFFTDELWLMCERYWRNANRKFTNAAVPGPTGDLKRQREDRTTAEFISYLKSERLLKALLVGHEHIMMEDRFSETAVEYVVGGNYAFHAQEVLFS